MAGAHRVRHMSRNESLPLDKFLSIKEVIEVTGLSRTTVWRLGRDGQFPKSRQISPGRRAFLRSEIEAWIREKAAEVAS